MNITTPLKQEDLLNLKIGDVVKISGTIYTARDAAHKRLVKLIDNQEELPFDLNNNIIYYVGPTPPKPGQIIGSAGPTTSYRMDPFTPLLMNKGLKATIGKGPRNDDVINAIIKNKGVYFAAVGGTAALISKSITKAKVIAYEDLGAEAIYELEVKNFPVIVAIDSFGNSIYKK